MREEVSVGKSEKRGEPDFGGQSLSSMTEGALKSPAVPSVFPSFSAV